MLRSNLVKALNDHPFIQYIFSALPAIFIIIFIFVYMLDLMSIVKVITYNDKVTQQAYDAGVLKEVEYFQKNADGSFKATISGEGSYEVEAKLEDEIFSVYYLGQDWYSVITNTNEVLYQTSVDFVDSTVIKDGETYIVKNDQEMLVRINDKVCTVYLDTLGSYKVVYGTEDINEYVLDELSMLSLKLVNDGSYRFDISASYSVTIDRINPSFCTNLPTSNLYYDEVSASYVQNISKDFAQNFILGSNILVVFVSMTMFCILLALIKNKHELTVLEHKEVMAVNVFAIFLLPLCVIFTLVFI